MKKKYFIQTRKIYPTGTNPTIVTHIARHCSFCCSKKRIQVDLCWRIKWMNFLTNFERLILGTFAKGSEHLKINSLYFYEYVVYGRRG
jgi:hypothetical protein